MPRKKSVQQTKEKSWSETYLKGANDLLAKIGAQPGGYFLTILSLCVLIFGGAGLYVLLTQGNQTPIVILMAMGVSLAGLEIGFHIAVHIFKKNHYTEGQKGWLWAMVWWGSVFIYLDATMVFMLVKGGTASGIIATVMPYLAGGELVGMLLLGIRFYTENDVVTAAIAKRSHAARKLLAEIRLADAAINQQLRTSLEVVDQNDRELDQQILENRRYVRSRGSVAHRKTRASTITNSAGANVESTLTLDLASLLPALQAVSNSGDSAGVKLDHIEVDISNPAPLTKA